MSSGSDERWSVSDNPVVESLQDYYHYLAVAVLMGIMLGIRLQPIDRFRGHDTIHLQAVDSFYHWRTTEWTIENFPYTMPYEVFTTFPTGTYVGQFGTLFDQVIALLALIIGLGSPGEQDILLAALLGVPLIAMLVAIPVYKIGERLGGRIGGIFGVGILALSPGQFLSRSVTGMFQHHAAEVLLMAVTIFAFMLAIAIAEREKPVYEQLLDRDWDGLRRPGGYGIAAGIALTLYIWAWPPGIVLVGILGVFFVIALTIDHIRQVSAEHLGIVGAIAMSTAGILLLILAEMYTLSTSPTDFSLLQPLLAFLVAGGIVFMAGLSRYWDLRGFTTETYPITIAAAIVAALGAMWLVLPDLYSTLIGNLTGRLLPIDPSVTAQTVSEARPPDVPSEFMFEEFGFAFYTMIAGLAVLVARPFVGQRYRTEHTLLVVWSLFLISMGLTQIRFNYYLVLAVAVINAYLVGLAIQWIDLPELSAVRDIKPYQVISIAVILMVLFMPLLPPIASPSAMDVADNAFPSEDSLVWAESNAFLADNAPAPGDWGEHENAELLDYYGVYDNPGDTGFDYPPGTFGVMAWWDYGHLITTQANHIPHANPFQHNARSAAAYFTADSEERAELILDAIAASGDGVGLASDEEYEQILEEHDGELGPEMRYVMIDDDIAAGKFSAIATWADQDFQQDYLEVDDVPIGEDETAPLLTLSEEYYESQLARLYLEDASDMEHYRLVHESPQQSIIASVAQFHDGEWHEIAINTRLSQFEAQFIQQQPELELYDVRTEPSVKTFERVDGATITGSVEESNDSVVAFLELETNAERPIYYTQTVEPDEDGTFEITVPYATTNDLGPEDGYTDTAVEAIDDLRILAGDEAELMQSIGFLEGGMTETIPVDAIHEEARVEVTEEAIYDGETISVELQDPPNFELGDIDAPETVDPGESFEATVELTNTGELDDEQRIDFLVDDEPIANKTVALDGGERTTVTFEHTIEEEGIYEIAIRSQNDQATHEINVGDVEPPHFAIETLDIPDEVAVNETYTINATIENMGEVAGEQLIELLVDGVVIDEQPLTLEAEANETITFELEHAEAGEYLLGVETEDELREQTVTVVDANGASAVGSYSTVVVVG